MTQAVVGYKPPFRVVWAVRRLGGEYSSAVAAGLVET